MVFVYQCTHMYMYKFIDVHYDASNWWACYRVPVLMRLLPNICKAVHVISLCLV